MSLFFLSLKTRHLEYLQKKQKKKLKKKKKLNEKKQQQQTNKYQFNNINKYKYLFTKRQEDQSFDKVLLGQNN